MQKLDVSDDNLADFTTVFWKHHSTGSAVGFYRFFLANKLLTQLYATPTRNDDNDNNNNNDDNNNNNNNNNINNNNNNSNIMIMIKIKEVINLVEMKQQQR